MRQINEDRRRHTLLLSKRLEEFAVARRQLVVQLEKLDAKARVVQTEVNSLQNLDAPISTLPDEMLAMVFEASTLLSQGPQCHFGSRVSHVTQHWRKIAMAIPRLWNKIYCIQPKGENYDDSYPNKWVQRDATFLERSRSFPVEIYISGFLEGDFFSQKFLHHIRNHIGQCSRLSITGADSLWLSRALEYLSCQPAPLLSSIELALQDTCDEPFEPNRLVSLFLPGALHLTTVQIHGIPSAHLPFCLPNFINVTSLQLTRMWIMDPEASDKYVPLRDTLMTLHALNHLELQLDCFITDDLRLPMVLPTIRFLQIGGLPKRGINAYGQIICFDDIIHSIYAESLTTLSIDGWNRKRPGLDLSHDEELESHFPSLQHLLLRNISPEVPDLRVVARRFPGIERLTCHAQEPLNPATSDIYHIITQAASRPGYREDDEDDESNATSHQHWPKLHTVAVSASDTPLDVAALHGEISRLQEGGHPIRKLKLPSHLCQMAGAEAMAHLRTIIEVDDFSMDWPTPFEFV